MNRPSLKLTEDNYYSLEADNLYMSNSQYKDFINCEAHEMGKLTGWKDPNNDALLLGSYVHSFFDGTLEKFTAEHPEMFQKNSELYAKFKHGDVMIQALQQDEYCMFALSGQKEVIVIAPFGGVWWKAKIDVYTPERRTFSDLKTVKGIRDKCWVPGYGYTSFMEAYGYLTQMSIYAELERIQAGREEWLEPIIVAVSKEDPPDKEIIGGIDQERIRFEIDNVRFNMERIIEVKSGREVPIRCERCRYCRETK
ncbi:PD-(D/E)XK nuclease-like domain-containing protein [Paenibacillus chitinolyticus]|uniref:PD-(D/E)XK nuclease-like domain-containing protein n=1 Tax=Paenibacillus chitinolyticus TaxID=79263 RepID=UPI002DB9F9A4|nr:PD-(D/E)XK nuclease-like domain-containing protein [Paenibacillus chitinolyticus]MEC0248872.1 PD-(D/E)XK nuclease-like domain-containing protein [Paenibacillus chitinolyticus]